jgi:transposase
MIRVDHWYLAVAPIDMRSGMDRLLAQIITSFGAAQAHTAYAFANPRANRMKVLVHDGLGLWMCTRRLHQGSLHWPNGSESHLQLSAAQWQALALGLPWRQLGTDASIRIL